MLESRLMDRWLGPMFGCVGLFLVTATALAQGGYSVVSTGERAGPTAIAAPAPVPPIPGAPGVPGPAVPDSAIPVTIGPPVTAAAPAVPGQASIEPPVTSIVPTRHGNSPAHESVEVVSPRHPDDYGGVSPGARTLPPGFRRLARVGRNGPVVEWPGFQMVPSGSRVFLAMTAQPTVTFSRPSASEVVYHLAGARVYLSNNRRPLLTESFDTPVLSATLRSVPHGVDLVIRLRAAAEPRMTQSSGTEGLNYIFIDFPPWTSPNIPRLQLPAIEIDSGPGGPTNPGVATPSLPAMAPADDTERPPPVRP